jgi:hypothetical protein
MAPLLLIASLCIVADAAHAWSTCLGLASIPDSSYVFVAVSCVGIAMKPKLKLLSHTVEIGCEKFCCVPTAYRTSRGVRQPLRNIIDELLTIDELLALADAYDKLESASG